MCGIAGVVHFDGRPAEAEAVERMMAVLAHRGPDDRGTFFDGPVGLGHRRLSVIDVAAGHQPMLNETGSVRVTYNGEVYNYMELRDRLRGHAFRTHCDTEVLVHLCEERGEQMTDELVGMFAFVLHDADRQVVFAARDHFGVKPLYYVLDDEKFLFASEIKALVASGLYAPRLNEEALTEYVAFQFRLEDRTMFEGVRVLPPGHRLVIPLDRPRAARRTCYWRLCYDIDTHHTEAYYADTLREMLRESVRLQLRSDVPLGAHLSGGLDSTTVCALAAARFGGRLHTFTGAFREGPAFDETAWASLAAERTGATNHRVYPTAAEFVEAMPHLMYVMDEPAAGPGLFPQFAVSKLARRHVTVVLGGQGGDELFGGYARYLVAYLEQCLKAAIFETAEPGKYVVTLEQIIPNLPLLHTYRPLIRRFWADGVFDDMDRRYFRLICRAGDAPDWISPDVWTPQTPQRMLANFRRVFHDSETHSYFNKMTHFDLKTLLPALLQVEDRTSMAVSLESRVPLLDHRIADLITRMPPTMRFRGGRSKHIFRRAAEGVVPEEILHRKDKMGFPTPLSEWSRGPVRDFVADVLLGPSARQRGILVPRAVERQIASERRFGRAVWGALCLELWFRTFLDAPGRIVARADRAREAAPAAATDRKQGGQ
jgi:asparagine synthase (glutamine-hydrolysing)